jgi:hypothetical protein
VHLRRQHVEAGDAVPRRAGVAVATHGRLLRAGPGGQHGHGYGDATKLSDVSHAYLTPEWPS